jgi:aminoglycoside phosphotransferase (APT) family kinase protein
MRATWPVLVPPVRRREYRGVSHAALEDALRRLVATNFGSGAFEVRPLKLGVSSLNYYIATTRGKYVARIDVLRTFEEFREDRFCIESCRAAGVCTPPLPVFEGTLLGVPISIRPYVAGSVATALGAPSSLVHDAGRQLARIHTASLATCRPWFYELAPVIPRVLDDHLKPVVRLASTWLQQPRIATETLAMVHTDYRLENLVATKDLVTVIDWEKATAGPSWFDVGLALFHLIGSPSPRHGLRACHAFLHGYREEARAFDLAFDSPREATTIAAATYILVDIEIYYRYKSRRQVTALDVAHAAYFRRYCLPTFRRFAERVGDW